MVTAHGSREQFYWYLNLEHQTWRADRYSQMNWLSLRTKQFKLKFKASGQWPLISEESVKQTSMHKKTWRSEDVTAWGAMNRRIIDRSVKELQMDVEVWKNTVSNVEARHLQLQNAVENLQVELEGWKVRAAWVLEECLADAQESCIAQRHSTELHPTQQMEADTAILMEHS